MTHRQRVGLVVFGLAFVLVALVAGLRPHLVAGAGQAAPVPGPPAVGDCVLDVLPGPGAIVTAAAGDTVPVYPAQQIRPCAGARYGEIASVIPVPERPVVKGDNADGRYLDDPNVDSCFVSAQRYVGTAATTPIDGFWFTSLQNSSSLSRPSIRQEAAGQHWAACVVAPLFITEKGLPTAERYGNSIRNAMQTGQERNQLGICITELDWHGETAPGNCGRPHSLEIVAFGNSGEYPVNRGQLELTCRQLVRRITAIPDPTAARGLSVQMLAEDDSSTAITTGQIPPNSNLACGVTPAGHRKLGGSLLALGRQPIPWA